MSGKVVEVEGRIRSMTPEELAELFGRIDDLYQSAFDRVRAGLREAALADGIDPDDDDAIQRIVNNVRYGHSDDLVR